MSDEPSTVEPEVGEALTPPAGPRLPPLTIRHLLLWTALASVLMASSQVLRAEWQAISEDTSFLVMVVLHDGSSSAMLGVVLLGCFWRRRGLRFFGDPGHALALMSVVWLLSNAVSNVIFGVKSLLGFDDLEPFDIDWFLAASLLMSLVSETIQLGVAWWSLRTLASSRLWKWVFVIVLVDKLDGVVTSLGLIRFFLPVSFPPFPDWGALVPFLLRSLAVLVMVGAVLGDFRRSVSRHWTHYTAVVVFVVENAAWLLWRWLD